MRPRYCARSRRHAPCPRPVRGRAGQYGEPWTDGSWLQLFAMGVLLLGACPPDYSKTSPPFIVRNPDDARHRHGDLQRIDHSAHRRRRPRPPRRRIANVNARALPVAVHNHESGRRGRRRAAAYVAVSRRRLGPSATFAGYTRARAALARAGAMPARLRAGRHGALISNEPLPSRVTSPLVHAIPQDARQLGERLLVKTVHPTRRLSEGDV